MIIVQEINVYLFMHLLQSIFIFYNFHPFNWHNQNTVLLFVVPCILTNVLFFHSIFIVPLLV